MTPLNPAYFFDLSTFSHASLFITNEYAWMALSRIAPYLSNQILGKIESEVSPGAYLVDAHLISIGKNTVVEPGAYIKGPCIIGANCYVRHGAYIRGNVITGDHCVIGHDTEIKNSILLNHAQAAHFAYLGDSIIGNHVNLGAGTKCANLKLNNGNVTIPYQDQRLDTGLRKLGAIIGDDCQLGCNSVTNPGTLLGKNVFCYPITNISGFVPSNSIAKNPHCVSIVSREIT